MPKTRRSETIAGALEDACPIVERHGDEFAFPCIEFAWGQFSFAQYDLAG